MLVSGCDIPKPPPTPKLVRADWLVEAYRDDRTNAEKGYTGNPVVVAVSTYRVVGHEIRCYIGEDSKPPVLVLVLEQEFPTGSIPAVIWVEGTCRGRRDDGVRREVPGYTFHVTVTGCRVVPPPTKPAF